MEPTVGRIVRVIPSAGEDELAAVITKVHSSTVVNLTVFSEYGAVYPLLECEQDDGTQVQSPRWRWPEIKRHAPGDTGG